MCVCVCARVCCQGKDLDDFDRLSLQESPDLLKWLTKQTPVPVEMDGAVFRQLQRYVLEEKKYWTHTQ